jgi:UDP-N-acetylmuramoyl-tripeptide--D-alanyl-D-alanine ligase
MALSYPWDQLAALSEARLVRPGASLPRRACVDSRRLEAGDLFVALPGERRDGHEFLAEAAARGASGAIVSREAGGLPEGFGLLRAEDPLAALQRLAQAHRTAMTARVIGVTGSNGKTTTKDMLAHLLAAAGKSVLSTRGNLNSQIGLPLMLLELTPEHTHAVLEMGASARGDIRRLAALARPDMGVLTGIGRAHLEFFGSVEGVLAAKWELVEALGKEGIAFLNADDARLMARRGSAGSAVVTFGCAPGADVRAENVRQDPQTAFDLLVGGARQPVRLPLPGLFNVTNALAAAAVALWERADFRNVARSLGTFTPPPDRMQMRRRQDGSLFLLDAYNANPDSMAASLASFAEAFPHWPRVAVLGSMRELGAETEAAHRELGRSLAGLPLARVFFLGPEAGALRAGYEAAGGKSPLWTGEEKPALSRSLAETLTPETVVLFKASRGVRLEDVYAPFLKED